MYILGYTPCLIFVLAVCFSVLCLCLTLWSDSNK